MAESLAEFFLSHFQAHSEERAYGQRHGYRMEWFTYGQVLEMASQFCRELERRGIKKGERVMLWGENCAEWVAAFFGCAMCGVIVVPMDAGAAAEFAGRVAGQVEAKLWICSRKLPRRKARLDQFLWSPLKRLRSPPSPCKRRQGEGTARHFLRRRIRHLAAMTLCKSYSLPGRRMNRRVW